MKISIIVPAYNAEKYIDNCMGSVLEQDFVDYEIVFVNDGSTDKTAAMCQRFIRNNQFIYVEQENQGQGSARNRAIHAATGEWLVFLDVDDDMKPGTLRCISNEIDKRKELDIICYGYTLHAEDGVYESVMDDVIDKHDLIRKASTFLWDKAIRRDFYADTNIQQCDLYGEDMVAIYLLLALSESYTVIHESFINHYNRVDNLSSKIEKVAEFPRSVEELFKVFVERKLFESFREDLLYIVEQQITLYADIISGRIGSKASKKICRALDEILEQNYPNHVEGCEVDRIMIGSDLDEVPFKMNYLNNLYFESMNSFLAFATGVFSPIVPCRRQVYFIDLDHEYMEVDTGSRKKEWLNDRWKEKVAEFSETVYKIGIPYSIYILNNRNNGWMDYTLLSEIAPSYEYKENEIIKLIHNDTIGQGKRDKEDNCKSTFWNTGEQYRLWLNENALLMLFKIRKESKYIPEYFNKYGIKKIYIYGAGYLGYLLFDEWINQGMVPLGFIEKEAGYHNGIKIYGINDELDEEGTIVVAVPHLYERIKEDLGSRSKKSISIMTLLVNVIRGIEG